MTKYQDNAADTLKQLALSAGAHGVGPGEGNMILRVEGCRTEHINMTDTSSTDGAKTINAGREITLSAGTALNLNAGRHSKEVCGGTKIIQASESIELHVGAASIALSKEGNISIKGVSISVEGLTDILLKAKIIGMEG